MSDVTIWSIVIGCAGIFVAVVGIIIRGDVRYPRPDNVPWACAPPEAVQPSRPKPTPRVLRRPPAPAAPAPDPSHAALARALTIAEAHTEMQRHIDCSPSKCPRKTQALGALAAAGVMAPSTRAHHKPLAGAPRAAIPVTRGR